MSVTYLIRFQVRPEQRERFLTLLNGVLDATRHEPMFHNAMLHVDPQDQNHMMLYETWEDHNDVLNVQIHRPYRDAWHAALPELLVKERDISMWHAVREDHRDAIKP